MKKNTIIIVAAFVVSLACGFISSCTSDADVWFTNLQVKLCDPDSALTAEDSLAIQSSFPSTIYVEKGTQENLFVKVAEKIASLQQTATVFGIMHQDIMQRAPKAHLQVTGDGGYDTLRVTRVYFDGTVVDNYDTEPSDTIPEEPKDSLEQDSIE